jgi:hypothetical protein
MFLSMKWRGTSLSILMLTALLLGGCQQSVSAYVTRFNSLSGTPGLSFTVVPDQTQVGSLEFQSVADQVAAALANYGFQPVPPNGPPADFAVFVHYGTPGARPQIVDWGPYYRPWPRGPYPYPPYDVYTLYSHFVEVEMLDGPAWRQGERRAVFQGRAVTESTMREINPVLPYLVRALFTNFPGLNGQTVRVSVPTK